VTAFDAAAAARAILAAAGTASLATLLEDGAPFASLVTVAAHDDEAGEGGGVLMLLSRLAVHTRNLERDPRASLLLVAPPRPGDDDRDGQEEDALAGARLTLTGTVAVTGDPQARALFLARHPEADAYAGFSDFAVHRLAVTAGHLVAGFGRIVTLGAADLFAAPRR